jgi:hypothetical protein
MSHQGLYNGSLEGLAMGLQISPDGINQGLYSNNDTAKYDFDATNFIINSGISNNQQKTAIYNLVRDLKGTNLWNKMKAIYPFIGGVAATHKWNLKDPRDLDAAYRLTFSGGITHSSTGVKFNGSTGYADTKLVPSTVLTYNSFSFSFYNRTNVSTDFGVDLGALRVAAPTTYNMLGIRIYYGGGGNHARSYGYDGFNVLDGPSANIAALGPIYFGVGSRTSSTSHKIFRNGILLATNTTATVNSQPNVSVYIGAMNQDGGPVSYVSKECAFAHIGDALTDGEVYQLFIIVQKYQTLLQRRNSNN